GIDGLPALPEKYQREPGDLREPPAVPHETVADKLRQAFGPDCPELTRPIRLELRNQNMVLAAGQFTIENDGRVRLAPLSVVLFGKEKNDGKGVEINTIKGDVAFFTFDKKIESLQEMGGRKIVAAELT